MLVEMEERRSLELFLERGSCDVEFVSGSGGTHIVRKDSSLDTFLTYYTTWMVGIQYASIMYLCRLPFFISIEALFSLSQRWK